MDVQKHLDHAIERYGSGVPAQVALSSATVILGVIFPPAALVPAGLQAGIAARASRIQQERIDEARAGVADQLEHLDQDKVDAKYVESDGFLDWLREAFDQIRRAEDTAKLDALKNVFVNGLIVGQSTGPLKDIILRRVGDLSSHHIRAIQAWSKVAGPLAHDDNPVFTSLSAANAARPFARIEEFRQELGDLTDLEFTALLHDLETMDIFSDWQARGTYDALQPMTRIVLSDFGAALVRFISDPTAS